MQITYLTRKVEMVENTIGVSREEIQAMGIDPDEEGATRKILGLLTGHSEEEFILVDTTAIEKCPTCGAEAISVRNDTVGEIWIYLER